jgi:hypothetical protein
MGNFLECADLSALLVGRDLSRPSQAEFISRSGIKPTGTKAATGRRTPYLLPDRLPQDCIRRDFGYARGVSVRFSQAGNLQERFSAAR